MTMSQATMDTQIHPMALLLAEIDSMLQEPKSGEIRLGVIVDKRPHELLVDIGFKSEGIVSGRELERIVDDFASLEVGDQLPVFILREDKDGNLQLSISRALAEQDWERAEELMQSQAIFEGAVESYNRGGVIVKVGQVRGFVPASQLSSPGGATLSEDEAANEERWAPLVGQMLKLKVIDIDRKRNRLILSERLAMREWRRQQKEQLLESLKEGDVYDGVISSIADFGAFARLDNDGVEGLIHISELSERRVAHPKEVVNEGEEYDLRIIRIDTDKRRMGLSLKQALPQVDQEVDWQIAPTIAFELDVQPA
jgi:small subunit ribosomal protein S1